MEVYYREVEKLRDVAIQNGGCAGASCKTVVQSVKAICATLYKIETAEVIKNVRTLQTLMADANRVSLLSGHSLCFHFKHVYHSCFRDSVMAVATTASVYALYFVLVYLFVPLVFFC